MDGVQPRPPFPPGSTEARQRALCINGLRRGKRCAKYAWLDFAVQLEYHEGGQ